MVANLPQRPLPKTRDEWEAFRFPPPPRAAARPDLPVASPDPPGWHHDPTAALLRHGGSGEVIRLSPATTIRDVVAWVNSARTRGLDADDLLRVLAVACRIHWCRPLRAMLTRHAQNEPWGAFVCETDPMDVGAAPVPAAMAPATAPDHAAPAADPPV